MTDAAVGFLLNNLEQLLSDKDAPTVDITTTVKALKTDLNLFKAFLKDSSEQPSNDTTETLRATVNAISDVVFNAEDAIDKLVIETARFKEKGFWSKAFNARGHSAMIQNVTKDIELLIRTEVKQIYDKNMLQRSSDKVVTQKKTPAVEEENVVGFDEVAETLIKRLNNVENHELDIITIVGMPGLGKTTLVRKIYNDQAIEYEFFTRAWVYISQTYNRKDVYISILSQIKPESDYTNKPYEVIVEDLRKCLEKGKYLIVLDDVWTADVWKDLKNAFPNNKNCSRILITSRHRDVAHHANPSIDGTHDLKFLTAPESWELLESKVFGKGKCPAPELHTLGENVAAKCDGLPLAIVVIAGILFNNRESSDWWKQVAKNVSTFTMKEKEFKEVISMSYNHLPYHLKSCFLYLGVFPEDYQIPVSQLINLWIAEGFIERDGELSLEDSAEVCLSDLVNRNLLMVTKRKSNGQIKTCNVHDMLHDFCKNEGAKQNLYQEIKKRSDEDKEVTSENCRRVCIHSNVMNYITSKPQGPRVRSFLCFPPDEIPLWREHIPVIPRAFELLRVLDIKSIIFSIFPKDLAQLSLLRYLSLSCNVKILPKSISQLLNMQTLIFLTKYATLELREEMWKMNRLRHLRTNASAVLPPPSSAPEGKGTMQSLSMISPESCTQHVLGRTPNVKKLGVRGKVAVLFNNAAELFNNVANLQHLTNLKLYNERPTSEIEVLKLHPSIAFPKKLKKLTLSNTLLDWVEMRILENVETLEVLKLKNNAFKGEIWEVRNGFLSLQLLHIERTDLMTWKVSQNQFPKLKRLVLQYCESLVEVPSGFGDIKSFQVLELYCTNPKAAASARRIQLKKVLNAGKVTKTSGVFSVSVYPPDV